MNRKYILVKDITELNTKKAAALAAEEEIIEEHIQPEIVGYTDILTSIDEEGNVVVTTPSEPIYEKRKYLVTRPKDSEPRLSIETLDLRLKTLESKLSMVVK